jgi:hypothetical protein
MKKYKLFIEASLKKKYKGATNFDKSFTKEYYLFRKFSLIRIKANKVKKKLINNDKTFEYLKNVYSFKSRNFNEKKIISFYKKFEINLALKKQYDEKQKKKTNLETDHASYVYLGLLLKRVKILDKYQKLNCILKIVDKILIEKKFKNDQFSNLRNLINFEQSLIKSIVQ